MNSKNHRVPLALALAALFAAALVPVTGAESPLTTLYTFNMGTPGAPTWVMLKLNVTEPGVMPRVTYRTAELHCPMLWGTQFFTGSPGETVGYNGLFFNFAAGRHGVDARIETPPIVLLPAVMNNDGADSCAWQNVTVEYGELPVGTVYALQLTAGVPFESSSTLAVVGPGVSVVGVSSGATSFFTNETDWHGYGGVVRGPPFCGSPTQIVNCPSNSMNAGGASGGASAHALRWTELKFKNRPWFILAGNDDFGVANASVRYPSGLVRYLPESPWEAGGLGVYAKGLTWAPYIEETWLGATSGAYRFQVDASAGAGILSQVGWHIVGADVWFPEDRL